MQYRKYASARARITEGAKVCFYRLLIKIFSYVNYSYLLLMCGWGWRGSGCCCCCRCCWWALKFAAAALGWIRLLKKGEKESCFKTATACLKQKAWLLTAGRKSFLAIKEASQFRFTFIIQRSFKKDSFCNLYLTF